MGVIVLYAIGFSKSFVVSTSLLGGITLAMQKDKKPLHYVIVVALVLVLYFVFNEMLHVRLP